MDDMETTASLLIQHHEQDRCTFSEFVVDTSVSVRVSGTGISMAGFSRQHGGPILQPRPEVTSVTWHALILKQSRFAVVQPSGFRLGQMTILDNGSRTDSQAQLD